MYENHIENLKGEHYSLQVADTSYPTVRQGN